MTADPVARLAQIAAELAAVAVDLAVRAQTPSRDDEIVDRRSCAISKREWDRIVATDPHVIRDGRRLVMLRGDFARALESRRVVRTAPVSAPRDDGYAAATAPRVPRARKAAR